MDFFLNLIGRKKDYIPKIDFSKYPQIESLDTDELRKYNRLRQVFNSCLLDFNLSYKQEYSRDARKKNLLEVTSFIWSMAQNIFIKKELSKKIGIALYYSIEEEFLSLTKELDDWNYEDFDDFFQSRSLFYVNRVNEMLKKQRQEGNTDSFNTYSMIHGLFTVAPLTYIADNHPSNAPMVMAGLSAGH